MKRITLHLTPAEIEALAKLNKTFNQPAFQRFIPASARSVIAKLEAALFDGGPDAG